MGWSGTLRYLHSFPTRRSSDLRHHLVHDDERYGIVGHRLGERRRDRVETLQMTAHAVGDRLLGHRDDRPLTNAPSVVRAEVRDRKSTRLNSSHGYISYAVFCLK